jgi:hypothetical protein
VRLVPHAQQHPKPNEQVEAVVERGLVAHVRAGGQQLTSRQPAIRAEVAERLIDRVRNVERHRVSNDRTRIRGHRRNERSHPPHQVAAVVLRMVVEQALLMQPAISLKPGSIGMLRRDSDKQVGVEFG